MKGKGIRRERETIINFNEEEKTAHIWTASEPMYRRLRKMGYCPSEDNERSASFVVPKRDIKLPRPKSASRIESSKRLAQSVRNTLFSSGVGSIVVVQPPNSPGKG